MCLITSAPLCWLDWPRWAQFGVEVVMRLSRSRVRSGSMTSSGRSALVPHQYGEAGVGGQAVGEIEQLDLVDDRSAQTVDAL